MIKYLLILLAISTSVCAEIKNIVCYELDANSILYNEDGSGKYKNPDPSRQLRHGWFVKKVIDNLEDIKKEGMIDLLNNESSYNHRTSVMCYQPRFAISFIKGKEKVEYHVCLVCHNRKKYINGKQEGGKATFTKEAYSKIKKLIKTENKAQ